MKTEEQVEKNLKTIHECEYYRGKISDVTLRRGDGFFSIHCKKCGEKLEESQVEPKMLKRIKNERNKRRN